MAINYLLSNLKKEYYETVGVVDLGGGSVQMAYAVSEENAKNAPNANDGDDPYITQMYLKDTKYYVYVHRYNNICNRSCLTSQYHYMYFSLF